MNFQERIERARQNKPALAMPDGNGQEEQFDLKYFGIENLRNHLACIDLRFADGGRIALPYSYIMEIGFDAAEGIEITTSTKSIKIKGRDLSRLYDYLIAYRVKYIQEHMGMDGGQEGLFIKEIEIK